MYPPLHRLHWCNLKVSPKWLVNKAICQVYRRYLQYISQVQYLTLNRRTGATICHKDFLFFGGVMRLSRTATKEIPSAGSCVWEFYLILLWNQSWCGAFRSKFPPAADKAAASCDFDFNDWIYRSLEIISGSSVAHTHTYI